MPIAMPPSIWPMTPSRNAGLPTSWAATTRSDADRAGSVSTSTSAICVPLTYIA